jgi:hypothetical protein
MHSNLKKLFDALDKQNCIEEIYFLGKIVTKSNQISGDLGRFGKLI